jgi:predicted  nucleic acid-binding Zn-ribbon protein
MANKERDHLLKEIEEIRSSIQTLQPELYEQQRRLGVESESRRAELKSLRKELAHDMELLHDENS